ncbi:hypothetical protein SK128_013026, partial [Halocaridina rubra]
MERASAVLEELSVEATVVEGNRGKATELAAVGLGELASACSKEVPEVPEASDVEAVVKAVIEGTRLGTENASVLGPAEIDNADAAFALEDDTGADETLTAADVPNTGEDFTLEVSILLAPNCDVAVKPGGTEVSDKLAMISVRLRKNLVGRAWVVE